MTTESTTATSYDEIPYPSDPLPQSHPDRLAAIGRLFGMQPPRIDRCRVLELGCGMGGNLIPMAERHPESSFVGIDYSLRQIESGRSAVAGLGLKNVALEHRSILDLGGELGEFDYIVCHGVYSWVMPDVQDKILSICKSQLAPQGIAYLSYNVYPAWHLRGIVREIARHGTSPDQPPAYRLAHLRRVLAFLVTALGEEASPYSQFLKDDIDFVLSTPDNYLFHEYFEDENRPVYFHQFAERAAAYGLQYLGDSIFSTMFPVNLGQVAERNMARFANDVIAGEQHMDILWSRSFRHTLLCHANISLERRLSLASLEGLYLAADLRPESPRPDLASMAPEKFVSPKGTAIGSPTPAVKAVLYQLAAEWPRAVKIDELFAAAAARLSANGRRVEFSAEEHQSLGDNLVQCLVAGLIEVHTVPDSFVATISSHPRASHVARAQARRASHVTNRRHEVVALDEVSQNTLAHLDGQHDRAALSTILREALDGGRLSVFRDGIPVGRGDVVEGILEQTLEQCLSKLARNALLVA